MKKWLKSTKAQFRANDEDRTRLNYFRQPLFHKYNVGGCRFCSPTKCQRAKSPPIAYLDVSLCLTDLTKSTETPAMSAICSRL